MPVTAPPRPPFPAVARALEALREEALIKEARQRARRRRQRYAAAVVTAAVIVGVGAVLALRPDKGGAQPSAAARPLAPAATSATPSTIVFATWSRNITATLYSINADGTGLHRLLSAAAAKLAGHRPSWPALSPDGRQVAFQTGNEPRTAVAVVNLDGTNFHQIARGGYPAWSPDGTKIAYSLGDSADPQLGVYVIRTDGTGLHLLARNGIHPSWSPDGTKLAYICTTPGTWDPVHLCVMNADGTRQHRIAPAENFARPAWSPNGSEIAFLHSTKISFGAAVDEQVYVINANGTNLRRLPPLVAGKNTDCRPAWSPNGKQIAFTPVNPYDGNVHRSNGGIYLMNADGRHVVHLKGTTGLTCGISWQRTPA